jgi:hypothetical protein
MNPVDVSKPGPVFTGSIGRACTSTEVRMRNEDGSWATCGRARRAVRAWSSGHEGLLAAS